jgi:hypothetical protein
MPFSRYSDDVLLTTAKSCGFDEIPQLARFQDLETPLTVKDRKWLVGHLSNAGPTARKIAAETHERHQDPEYMAFLTKMRRQFEGVGG